MKKRFTEERIVGILREAETGRRTIGELARAHGISEPTFYVWRRKYGSMSEPDVKRLRELGEGERAAKASAGRA